MKRSSLLSGTPGWYQTILCAVRDLLYWDRQGKALAKIIRAQMHPDDILYYYRSQDDDSGVVIRRSRVRETSQEDL